MLRTDPRPFLDLRWARTFTCSRQCTSAPPSASDTASDWRCRNAQGGYDGSPPPAWPLRHSVRNRHITSVLSMRTDPRIRNQYQLPLCKPGWLNLGQIERVTDAVNGVVERIKVSMALILQVGGANIYFPSIHERYANVSLTRICRNVRPSAHRYVRCEWEHCEREPAPCAPHR